jgi:two-component system nitrate/nitrite response regulator NarL
MIAKSLKPPYRVAIIDDHKFLGELLAQRLGGDGALQIVGIASRGSAALQLVRTQPVDIVLLDIELEQEDGVAVARHLLEACPHLRIIGLSMHDSDYHPAALLEIGAFGFISKRAGVKDIIEGIKRVASGDMAVSPQVAVFLATCSAGSGPIEKVRGLTTKESAVLGDIARGFTVKEIARRNGVTEKTVQTHRCNMRKKLNVQTDVELCLIALKAGLVDLHHLGS